MVVAFAKASPSMAWISLASPISMDDATHWESSASLVGLSSRHCAREASNEWPTALANEMSTWESTATLAFHISRMGSGIGYWKRGTLGGLAVGASNASVDKIGRCKVPMPPWWSRKAVWTVIVSSV